MSTTNTTTRYPQSYLGACMVPWTADFQLDVKTFERHIDDTLNLGMKSLYLFGTAGEGYALTDEQYRQIVDVFAARTVREGIEPQVGVISLSMGQIIDRLKYAAGKGINMYQISLPSWGALDQQETMLFFKTVCGSLPEGRFLHYNLPRAKRIIDGREYARICEQVPNLVATKNSTSDYARTSDLLRYAPMLQHFLLEGNWHMGAPLGECSLLCSFACLFPKTSRAYFQAGVDGDLAELKRIGKLYFEIVMDMIGLCSREAIDGAYDKTFIHVRDRTFPNRLLPPYLGLSDADTRGIIELVENKYGDVD